jgi:hypothetical protein
MSDPLREGNAAPGGKRFPESLPRGRRGVVWASALCGWGAFLAIVGAVAHHASIPGILAGLICLGLGLRWLALARQELPRARQELPRDAQGPETR